MQIRPDERQTDRREQFAQLSVMVMHSLCFLLSQQELRAEFNFIVSIPSHAFAHVSKLVHVFMGGNELQQFPPVHALPHLTHLHLNNNKITAIADLSACTKLRVLDLRSNRIPALCNIEHCLELEWSGLLCSSTPCFILDLFFPPAS
eukprot:m.765477 g.765477  ORF g.765477 m.765477 type:complete len:147 (+) comp59060_c0_seq8:135-575(+)